MSVQTRNGKAFEYAVSEAFYSNLISNNMNVIRNSVSASYITAKQQFNNLDANSRIIMTKAASASVKTILLCEPNLSYGTEEISIYIQEDSKGITGDVSDVVLRKNSLDWQCGISCKHNHFALKHSRLSDTIDFGKNWLGYPCSINYWNVVKPHFGQYRNIIKGLPKVERPLWKDIAPTNKDKIAKVYVPILEAFKDELLHINESNPDVPKRLVHYLLGRKDFYKVISRDKDKSTTIQAFNIHDTLSESYRKIRPEQRVVRLSTKMPTKIFDISFNDSKTTLIVTMDQGWAVSMRLHSASSRIEPSLKFDIQLVGVPGQLTNINSSWT